VTITPVSKNRKAIKIKEKGIANAVDTSEEEKASGVDKTAPPISISAPAPPLRQALRSRNSTGSPVKMKRQREKSVT
jgi:hypothetical protein